MIQYTEMPVFFERNRVWRVYKGGKLFGDLLGDLEEDNNYPEEWIASTVEAFNDKSTVEEEGLSVIVGTDITLKSLLEAYPKETLGNRSDLGILIKYLDSAIRLPLQAHPDKEFSEKHFNSSYGKTEMWLVLDTREDASICFGFKNKMSKETFSEIIERSKTEKDIMDKHLNKVSVKPGDVYLIPAKAVHAIGAGCLILEVQEPTDFTIQPEYWCGNYLLNDQQMYMNLPKDIALDCFDYSIHGKESIELSKKLPIKELDNENYQKERLISRDDTPCFCVNRYTVKKQLLLDYRPATYIISKGEGKIEGSGYTKTIKKGDYFFLPQNALGKYKITAKDNLELIECYA